MYYTYYTTPQKLNTCVFRVLYSMYYTRAGCIYTEYVLFRGPSRVFSFQVMELRAAGWKGVDAMIKGARPEILDGSVKRILMEEAKRGHGCIE